MDVPMDTRPFVTRRDEAVQAFCRKVDNERLFLPPIPEGAGWSVGQSVHVSYNKVDCTVDSLLYDGRAVVVRFTEVGKRYSTPYRHEDRVSVYPWQELTPGGATEYRGVIAERASGVDWMQSPIQQLLHIAFNNGLIDNPDYQRGYVWTSDDQQGFLDAFAADRDFGKFVFVRHPHPELRMEILDGKQRLNTLFAFYTRQISYRGTSWDQLGIRDRQLFMTRIAQYAIVDAERVPLSERLKLFLELNSSVPQLPEHLDHVRALLQQALAEEGNADA